MRFTLQWELVDVIAGPLSTIYQRSWKVPLDWRLGNVIPIYRKGTRVNPGNYRPFSLTSDPQNAMEKIILGDIEK